MRIKVAQSTFPAKLSQLELIRNFIEHYSAILGFNSSAIYDLMWAITEIVTNVIEHGYKNEDGSIEVILLREGPDFIMQVRDEAPVFKPSSSSEPDLSLPLDKRPMRGLGLYMTKKIMDSLTHRVTETGGNEITMIKKGIIEDQP